MNKGDQIYCYRVPDEIFCIGSFQKEIGDTGLIEFIDLVTGQFRLTTIQKIVEDPTRQQLASVGRRLTIKNRKKPKK